MLSFGDWFSKSRSILACCFFNIRVTQLTPPPHFLQPSHAGVCLPANANAGSGLLTAAPVILGGSLGLVAPPRTIFQHSPRGVRTAARRRRGGLQPLADRFLISSSIEIVPRQCRLLAGKPGTKNAARGGATARYCACAPPRAHPRAARSWRERRSVS